MLKTEILADGRIYTYSDAGMQILQTDTGILYFDAIDTVAHTYEETDIPIPDYSNEATAKDYEAALNRLGVTIND